MNEIWKDIEGFEGYYQISNLGRVKSFCQPTQYRKPKEHILKPSISNTGYCQVTLYKDTKRKKFLVHRLVAFAFVPNPNDYPHINHKDENKLNNSAENLEWCTALYNNRYGTAKIRSIETRRKPVEQLTLDGTSIAKYYSIKVASDLLGFDRTRIQKCCNNGGVGYGYYWRYCSKDI